MTKPTIQDYEQASGLDFSMKSLARLFQESLYSHSIPETNLKVISAKANQEYLGQYSFYSQFRHIPTMQIHIQNHFNIAEEEYLAEHKFYEPDHPLDLSNLTDDIKKNIAIRALKSIKETMWHEYGHAIYEYFKAEHSEYNEILDNHKEVETFKTIKTYFGTGLDGEEEFTESLCRLYANTTEEELHKIASYPLAVEESILHNSVKTYVEANFYPEHYSICSNPENKKLFIADCFLKGFGDPEEGKYCIRENTPYDFKVHETFLKNEVRLMKDKFFNPIEIVYIQSGNSSKKYPMIKIGNSDTETGEAIIIDSVAPGSTLNNNKHIYLESELSILPTEKRKTPKLK